MHAIRYKLLILILLCITGKSYAQDNFGVNFIFLTWHPGGDDMAFLQPGKLDKNASLVVNWGGVLHYERYIYRNRISVKIAQAAYSDCAQLFAGHTHLAFRINALNGENHALRFGFGPTWVYRKSWDRFPGYVQKTDLLKVKGDWQRTFVWYGGEIEYDVKVSQKMDVNLHVIPGIPDFFTFGIGTRIWLNRPPSNKTWRANPNKRKLFYGRKAFEQIED